MKKKVSFVKKCFFTFFIITSISVTCSPALGFDLSGEKVDIIVPFAVGGGTDTLVRLFQPFLSKHLPGNPTIIVRNVPGGGSLKGANKFQSIKKTDGKTLLAISASTYATALFGGSKVKFDILSWEPIIISPLGYLMHAQSKTGVKGKDQIEDIKTLQHTKIIKAMRNYVSGQIGDVIGLELMGIKNVEVIVGLSSGDAMQGHLRGDFSITFTSPTTIHNFESLIEKGTLIPICTNGIPQPDGTLSRDPTWPNFMTMPEIAEALYGKEVDRIKLDAYKSFTVMNTAGKGLFLPANTPKEIIDVYINAFKKCFNDPLFIQKAGDIFGKYTQYYGKDAEKIIRKGLGMKPETKVWFKKWLKEQYNADVTLN